MGIDEPDIDPERFLEDVEMRVGTVVSVAEAGTTVDATAAPEDFLQEAASRMLREDVSHLPVIADDDLVGMLSKTDVTDSQS